MFEDISQVTPDVERELTISGGFLNNLASTSDAKSFTYVFEGIEFPYVPLLQPRLGSIEEWTFLNNNNDEHPIHIHVNDFQVTHYFDPTRGIETGPEMWAVDNANVPAPSMGAEEAGHPAGRAQLAHEVRRFHRPVRDALPSPQPRRQRADDDGQCHPSGLDLCGGQSRIEGAAGASEDLRRQRRQLVATVTPFAGFEGTPSVAMGDVNDDGVYDLVVGAGKDHAPEVVAYSGKAEGGKYAFETELARFEAFDSAARGGVSVAASQIDGSTADNIIVGSGAGMPSEVKVFRAKSAVGDRQRSVLVLVLRSLSRG